MTSRLRFISTHRAVYGVKRLCQVLAVSRSGFYRWVATEPDPAARAAAEDALAEQITTIHAESGGSYGSPRVTAELRARGLRIQAHRAGDARPRHRRRAPATTQAHHDPDPAAPPAPDLIGRDFAASSSPG